MIELGGNIQLIGFSELDNAHLLILKKIIGNYARKFSDNAGADYESLAISAKSIHNNKYEIQTKLMISGKPVNSDDINNNLFMAVSGSLQKIEKQLYHNH